MKPAARKALFATLRTTLGLGLAAFLLYKVVEKSDVDLAAEFAHSSQAILIAGLIVYGFIISCSILRWRLLLQVQGFHWKLFDLTKLTMIGQFFNIVIPGGVGGDVVKMAYVRHHAGDRTTEAITTIMLDRVLGLFGLFVVAVVACLLNIGFLRDADPKIQSTTFGIALAAFGAMTGSVCVIFRERLQRLPLVRPTVEWFAAKLPEKVTSIFTRMIKALDLYKNHKGAVFAALGFSVVIHGLNGVVLYMVCHAFGADEVPLMVSVLAIQVANTFASVPILPGGLGARDYVVQAFLLEAGAEEGKTGAVPLFFSFNIIFYSLVGGLFFVFGRAAKDPDLMDEDLELEESYERDPAATGD